MSEENISIIEKKEVVEEKLEDMARNDQSYTEKDMKKALNEWKLYRKLIKLEAKRKKNKIKTLFKVRKAVDKKYGIGLKEKTKSLLSNTKKGFKKAGSWVALKAKSLKKNDNKK